MFSLICVWINGWVNNREAGDLRRYRAHYDVTVVISRYLSPTAVHDLRKIFCMSSTNLGNIEENLMAPFAFRTKTMKNYGYDNTVWSPVKEYPKNTVFGIGVSVANELVILNKIIMTFKFLASCCAISTVWIVHTFQTFNHGGKIFQSPTSIESTYTHILMLTYCQLTVLMII